jgi:hypothetical protein
VPFCIDRDLIAPGTISEGDFLQLSPFPARSAQPVDSTRLLKRKPIQWMSLSGKKIAVVDYVSMARCETYMSPPETILSSASIPAP